GPNGPDDTAGQDTPSARDPARWSNRLCASVGKSEELRRRGGRGCGRLQRRSARDRRVPTDGFPVPDRFALRVHRRDSGKRRERGEGRYRCGARFSPTRPTKAVGPLPRHSDRVNVVTSIGVMDVSVPERGGTSRIPPPASPEKVKVHFKPIANAPILRKSKFQVNSAWTCSELEASLRSMLQISDATPLFLYCNSAFEPSPDQSLSDLYK
ncbi:unnamed protein product, partial [Ectocarpus fasciculatus]